jgi:hypothetical protein
MKYQMTSAPSAEPPRNATPGLSKWKILITTPPIQLQARKNSGTALLDPRDRLSLGRKTLRRAIKPIPVNSHPKVFESGISG